MKILDPDMLQTNNMRQVKDVLSAEAMANTFPRMRRDFDAIKNLREVYARLNIEAAMARRSSAGLGRRVAHLPRPAFLFLSKMFPEVLRNKQLLRAFLRANPHYLLVEKI